MAHCALEVADIFRTHGPDWRNAQRGHLSLGQFKVMSAIEQCRSAALGGHVLRFEDCGQDQIAYNSCRNRHCPKCQASAAQRWLQARQADLLPVDYYHVVFTLPAPISAIAYYNKAEIYALLFDAAAETLLTIAADPKHLGASIGATLVLHTWGSALTHHPHVHGIARAACGSSANSRGGPTRTPSRTGSRRCANAIGSSTQTPVRRTRSGAGLFVTLHAPRRHLQQPACCHGRTRRHLPLEGLSGQGPHPTQDDDARCR
jgi:hypothetical protein